MQNTSRVTLHTNRNNILHIIMGGGSLARPWQFPLSVDQCDADDTAAPELCASTAVLCGGGSVPSLLGHRAPETGSTHRSLSCSETSNPACVGSCLTIVYGVCCAINLCIERSSLSFWEVFNLPASPLITRHHPASPGSFLLPQRHCAFCEICLSCSLHHSRHGPDATVPRCLYALGRSAMHQQGNVAEAVLRDS